MSKFGWSAQRGGGYQWGHLNELPPTLLEIQLSGFEFEGFCCSFGTALACPFRPAVALDLSRSPIPKLRRVYHMPGEVHVAKQGSGRLSPDNDFQAATGDKEGGEWFFQWPQSPPLPAAGNLFSSVSLYFCLASWVANPLGGWWLIDFNYSSVISIKFVSFRSKKRVGPGLKSRKKSTSHIFVCDLEITQKWMLKLACHDVKSACHDALKGPSPNLSRRFKLSCQQI